MNLLLLFSPFRCDEDEFNVYRETVGFIMGEMLIKIMNPLYGEKHIQK